MPSQLKLRIDAGARRDMILLPPGSTSASAKPSAKHPSVRSHSQVSSLNNSGKQSFAIVKLFLNPIKRNYFTMTMVNLLHFPLLDSHP